RCRYESFRRTSASLLSLLSPKSPNRPDQRRSERQHHERRSKCLHGYLQLVGDAPPPSRCQRHVCLCFDAGLDYYKRVVRMAVCPALILSRREPYSALTWRRLNRGKNFRELVPVIDNDEKNPAARQDQPQPKQSASNSQCHLAETS